MYQTSRLACTYFYAIDLKLHSNNYLSFRRIEEGKIEDKKISLMHTEYCTVYLKSKVIQKRQVHFWIFICSEIKKFMNKNLKN